MDDEDEEEEGPVVLCYVIMWCKIANEIEGWHAEEAKGLLVFLKKKIVEE